MAINAISLKCPECGASISIEEGRESVFCSYCGAKVYVKNDNEYIYRHIDEAGVKQAENDRLLRLRQLEIEERNNRQSNQLRVTLFYAWLAVMAIVGLYCLFQAMFGSGSTAFLVLFYVGAPVAAGGAYILFKLIPDREEDKAVRANGGIKFPKDLGTFSEQHYETIEHALKMAGFTNVSCINLHDLTLGLFTKPGKVEKVTVDGKEIQSGGRFYDPSVPITISYHGK